MGLLHLKKNIQLFRNPDCVTNQEQKEEKFDCDIDILDDEADLKEILHSLDVHKMEKILLIALLD